MFPILSYIKRKRVRNNVAVACRRRCGGCDLGEFQRADAHIGPFLGGVPVLTLPGLAPPGGLLPIRGAAAPLVLGRFKGVFPKRGEIEIPPLWRVFGSFLHEQKGTPRRAPPHQGRCRHRPLRVRSRIGGVLLIPLAFGQPHFPRGWLIRPAHQIIQGNTKIICQCNQQINRRFPRPTFISLIRPGSNSKVFRYLALFSLIGDSYFSQTGRKFGH